MATLPTTAFTLKGGCNCTSIRYTLSFPASPKRSIMLPASKSHGQGDIKMPQTAVCFCNDCRTATASLVLFAIMAPYDGAYFSFATSDGTRLEIRGDEFLPPKDGDDAANGTSRVFRDTSLAFYRSSEMAVRGFCNKCGTQFLYVYTVPLEPGVTSGGLDFYLGSIDKPDLEVLGGIDRFVHADLGIPWVKGLFVRREDVAWHPLSDMSALEKESKPRV